MCSSSPIAIAGDVVAPGASLLGQGIAGALNAPDAPTLPQYPSLTPEEQANLKQQSGAATQMGGVVSGLQGQLGNNQNILQMISGLFNQDGSVNQNAVAQLQQQIGSSTQAAGQAGQQQLASVGGNAAALNQTQQAYSQALQGNAPANQQMQFQQQQNFNIMKEQAAQQGIQINGDNWQNAISNSTAGQKLIQNYQQNSNIQNQNYQLGYLGQLGTNMGQLSNAGMNAANTGMGLAGYAQQTPTGYLGQSITGGQAALAPFLSQYQNQLSSGYQPLYMQQIGPYQQQMAQAQANYQAQNNQYQGNMNMLGGIMNLGGKLGAAALGGG